MKPIPFLISAVTLVAAGALCGRYWAGLRSVSGPESESRDSSGEQQKPANTVAVTGTAGQGSIAALTAPASISRVERLLLAGKSVDLLHDPEFPGLVAAQPELVVATLNGIPLTWREHTAEFNREEIYHRVLSIWAAQDAPAALRAAESVPVTEERFSSFHGVVEGALSGNQKIALAALQACVVSEDSAREAAQALSGSAEAAGGAFRLSRQLPPSPGRNRLLGTLMEAAIEYGPQVGTALWSEISAAEKEDLALGGFFPREQAASGGEGEERETAPGSGFPGSLAAGRAALEKCLPEERGELLFEFFNGPGTEWAAQEPEAAYAWLERSATPHQVTVTLHQFGKAAAASHPDLLMKIAASQPSPHRTWLLTQALLEKCPESFLPSAKAYIATLPAETQRLLAPGTKR